MNSFYVLMISFLSITFCFWDYDTIEMERQQFPSVIELISGNFLRHSPEFYDWRIQDREEKLKKHPDSLDLYDDLAVAYSKIGNDNKAIQIILKKDSISPQNYKTYANLGTFYIHNGQLEKGIEYIDKAIQINPNAHFGREIYQKYLAQYVVSKKEDGKVPLPLSTTFRKCLPCPPRGEQDNFYSFLLQIYRKKHDKKSASIKRLPDEEIKRAVKGIMGMMKFGNYDSPILLEALGDLLVGSGWAEGARQLAARAYLKASYHPSVSEVKYLYDKKVGYLLYHQFTDRKGERFTLEDLEKSLKDEIEKGTSFYQNIRNDEIRWIQNGQDPDVEFAKKYYREPTLDKTIQKTTVKGREIEKTYKDIVDYRPENTPNRVFIEMPNNSSGRAIDTFQVKEKKVVDQASSHPDGEDRNTIIYKILFPCIGILFVLLVLLYKRKTKP